MLITIPAMTMIPNAMLLMTISSIRLALATPTSPAAPVLTPPGDARRDLDIIVDMGKRLGLDWTYTHPRDVFADETK